MTAEVPLDADINSSAQLSTSSLLHALLRSDGPVTVRGFKGTGKTHAMEVLREFYHSKLAQDEEKGTVAFVDANEVGRRLKSVTSSAEVHETFAFALAEAAFEALSNKTLLSRKARRGQKNYTKDFCQALPPDQPPPDTVDLAGELVAAMQSIVAAIKSGQSLEGELFHTRLASALMAACPPLRTAFERRELSIRSSFDFIAWMAQKIHAIGGGNLYVCIDDLSELPSTQRRVIEQALSDAITAPWAKDGKIRLRFSFYPSKIYGPQGWDAKRFRSTSVDPHDAIPLKLKDPLMESDSRMVTGFFKSLLEARFRSMAADLWPTILGKTTAQREEVIQALYFASSGQPRKVGLVLRHAIDIRFRQLPAKGGDNIFQVTSSDVKEAAVALYDSFSRADGMFDMFPDEIVGLVELGNPSSDVAMALRSLWARLTKPQLGQEMGIAPSLESTILLKDDEVVYLAPLVNSGHLMRRARFAVASASGRPGVFSAFSLNFGYCTRNNVKWDVTFPLTGTDIEFDFCTDAASAARVKLLTDVRAALVKSGIVSDEG